MIVPFLGFIGKPKKWRVLAGQSSESGFMLYFKNKSTFNTKQYTEKKCSDISNRQVFITRMLFFSVFIALLLFCFGLLFAEQISLIVLVFGFFLVILWFTFFGGLLITFLDKDVCEWHACEHKSVVLLDAGLEPTIANLKIMPKTLIICGTSHLFIFLEFLTGALLTHILISYHASSLPVALSVLIPYTSFLLLIFYSAGRKINNNKLKIMFVGLYFTLMGLSFTFIPMLLERTFALREPSEEKLKQTSEELLFYLQSKAV